MDITAILQSLVSPQQKQAPLNINRLPEGAKLTGTVIQADLDGMVLMDFGKFRAVAKIAIPVDKGQILHFNVVKTDEQITLKISPPEIPETPDLSSLKPSTQSLSVARFEIVSDQVYKEILSEIKTLSAQNMTLPDGQKIPPTIQHALQKIDVFLEPMALEKGVFQIVSQLKAFVEDSGIFFEKKIEKAVINLMRTSLKASTEDLGSATEIKQIIAKDLKPDLLILKSFLDDPEVISKAVNRKGLQHLHEAVTHLLANVDQQQEIATHRPNDPDTAQVFTYVLPFQEENQKTRFKIYYPKKKPGEQTGSHRVSLLLEMEHLGTVRADLVPVNKDLNITFFVQNDITRQLIEANYAVLTDALDTTFNHFFLRATISEKKIDQFDTEDLNLTSNRQIDIRA